MEQYKTSKGEIRYRESIKIGNKRIKSPSFKRKTDAKTWLRDMQNKRDLVKIHGEKHVFRERVPFELFVVDWLENNVKHRNARSTFEEYQRSVQNKLLPFLEGRYLDQITRKDADKLVESLTRLGHEKSGINKILGVLKTILIQAEKDEIILRTPLQHYPMLKTNKQAADFWTEEEIEQFLEANQSNYLYSLYLVAVNTGLRKGELAGLCFDKVHFSKRLIEVSRTRDRML